MNCHQARTQLESSREADAGQPLLAHLRECDDCRDYAEELRLIVLLRSLPVRESRPGFETRALSAALAAVPEKRAASHATWSLAVAASVLLAVVVTLRLATHEPVALPAADIIAEAPAQTFTVTARPMETRIVDVVLDSKHPLENATMIVTLDENLMLENRPQTRELRWQTNIAAGGNKLSLPVQLINSAHGEMTVTLEHGTTRQQVKVRVKDGITPNGSPQASI